MFFRSPVRLEPWIAYDGALGAEALAQAANAEANDGAGDADNDFTFVSGDDGDAFGDADNDAANESAANDGDSGNDSANAGDHDPAAFAFAPFAVNAPGGDTTLTLEGLAVGGSHNGSFTVTLPGGAVIPVDGDVFFPFFKPGSFFTSSANGGSIQAGDIYFEISAPDGGDFGFFKLSDADGNANFGSEYGLTLVADQSNPDNSTHMMFATVEGGKTVLQEYRYAGGGAWILATGSNGVGRVEFLATPDGGLRFHLLSNGRSIAGNALLDSVFRSITFTPDADAQGGVTGFYLTAYHKDGVKDILNKDALFSDASGGMYDPGNGSVAAGSTTPGFEHPNDHNPNPVPPPPEPPVEPPPEPPVEPPPEPPVEPPPEEPPLDDPLNPFIPTPGDSGGGDSTGDGDSSAGDGDSGGESSDSGGESGGDGDSGDGTGGDGLSGDEPAFIFRRDDEGSAGAGRGDAAEEAREKAAPDAEADPDAEAAKAPATAAQAELLTLARDVEFLLSAVQSEKAVLLGLLGRLESEYLARDAGEYGDLRGYLSRLFDMGRREEATVNRIIDAMEREMNTFRGTDAARRDGMLAESVRELIDSAERRSGEMGAFSQAVEAVAELLAARREEGLPPPTPEEVEALFAAKYQETMGAWLANAERIDPMGRDLTAVQRVGTVRTE